MFDVTEKKCTKCKKVKPVSGFHLNRLTADMLSSQCKACSSESVNVQRIKKYGLSVPEYNQMMEEQGGVCFLCKEPPGKRRLNIDHCHDKGHVRRLLCTPCNTGLGMFKDRPEILRAAADYLEDHKDGRNTGTGS